MSLSGRKLTYQWIIFASTRLRRQWKSMFVQPEVKRVRVSLRANVFSRLTMMDL